MEESHNKERKTNPNLLKKEKTSPNKNEEIFIKYNIMFNFFYLNLSFYHNKETLVK